MTKNPLKLFRYWRAWNRLKGVNMEGVKKWNSRKLLVALVMNTLVWVVTSADLGLGESELAPIVEVVVDGLLWLGAIIGNIFYMRAQGKVDELALKQPPK